MHDTLSEGRPYRILAVVDNWSRSSPVIEAGFRMSGRSLVIYSIVCSESTQGRGPSPLIMGRNFYRVP